MLPNKNVKNKEDLEDFMIKIPPLYAPSNNEDMSEEKIKKMFCINSYWTHLNCWSDLKDIDVWLKPQKSS